MMVTRLSEAAQARHVWFHLDVVNEDREDWRRIEGVYSQVTFAWRDWEEDGRLAAFVGAMNEFFRQRGKQYVTNQ